MAGASSDHLTPVEPLKNNVVLTAVELLWVTHHLDRLGAALGDVVIVPTKEA
ncbi:hypothetical protein [Micromonospora sp. NPDC049645]|uniref:hypothetical protein n=1 Tax=Micromonospora sp. NPDC049645 TaxID=3155508 RepID=UPI003420F986